MTALSRRQFTNYATSTLASALASGATSLQVAAADGAKFPQPSDLTDGHFYATLEASSGDIEIVKVTARATDTFTIVRQQEGTTSPASFPDSTTRVELRVTAGLLAEWLVPSWVRWLSTGLGITFEGPTYPGTATDIATIRGLEDPLRAGKLILDISGSSDADVRVHADSRKVMLQDIYYPDGTGSVGDVLQLTATNEFGLTASAIQVVNSADVNLTKRSTMKFSGGITAVDNSGDSRTDISTEDLTGTIYDWPKTTAPSWGLICDGNAYDRTVYAGLFAVIGTTYGAPTGTSFRVPDLRGRVVAGYDAGNVTGRLTGLSGGVDASNVNNAGGAQTHTLDVTQIPAHNHAWGGGPISGTDGAVGPQSSGSSNQATSFTGGGLAHNNVQPTIIMNKVIRYKP